MWLLAIYVFACLSKHMTAYTLYVLSEWTMPRWLHTISVACLSEHLSVWLLKIHVTCLSEYYSYDCLHLMWPDWMKTVRVTTHNLCGLSELCLFTIHVALVNTVYAFAKIYVVYLNWTLFINPLTISLAYLSGCLQSIRPLWVNAVQVAVDDLCDLSKGILSICLLTIYEICLS